MFHKIATKEQYKWGKEGHCTTNLIIRGLRWSSGSKDHVLGRTGDSNCCRLQLIMLTPTVGAFSAVPRCLLDVTGDFVQIIGVEGIGDSFLPTRLLSGCPRDSRVERVAPQATRERLPLINREKSDENIALYYKIPFTFQLLDGLEGVALSRQNGVAD